MTKRKKAKGKDPGVSFYIRNLPDLSPDVGGKVLTSAENPSTKMATKRLNRT